MIDTGRIKRDELDEIDRVALDRAIDLVCSEEPEFAEIVRGHLAEGDYWIAGASAAFHRQADHLQIGTELPPCAIDPDEIEIIIARGLGNHNPQFGSATLLRKMLALGVSPFDPSPITSMALAQQRRRKAR